MRVIGLRPGPPWQPRVTLPDGRVRYLTGQRLDHGGRGGHDFRRAARWHADQGERLDLVEAVVFEAALRPLRVTGSKAIRFADRDDPDGLFSATPAALERIFAALAQGRLRVEDGCFIGQWTLTTMPFVISLNVWDGAEPLADGAPPDPPPRPPSLLDHLAAVARRALHALIGRDPRG